MPDAREEGNHFKILPPLGGSSDDDTIAYTHEVILGTLGALLHAVVIITDAFPTHLHRHALVDLSVDS